MRFAHRIAVAAAVGLSGIATSSPVEAQLASTSRPKVTWIGPGRPGDSAGGTRQGDDMGELQLEPLRLMMLGSYFPHPYGTPGCSDQLADTRAGYSGLSLMWTAASNLLGTPTSWKAPRLTLFGFSRAGCALDGAVAGGLTFVMPIRRDISFVLSSGAIYLPHGSPTGSAVSSNAARADVLFTRPGGRSLAVGVGNTRGVSGVSFSGTF